MVEQSRLISAIVVATGALLLVSLSLVVLSPNSNPLHRPPPPRHGWHQSGGDHDPNSHHHWEGHIPERPNIHEKTPQASMVWKSPALEDQEKSLPLPPGVTVEGGPLDDIASTVFLMLKTGHRVLRTRLPVHIDTTLRRWPHYGVYGDFEDVVNGVNVQDVFARLPSSILNHDQMLEYRIVQELRNGKWGVDSDKIKTDHGWDSDKFKNMPMLADAWQHVHQENMYDQIDWYVFIDDDTFVFQGGLLQLLKRLDPREAIYTGSPVSYGIGLFAHGGSGGVISREAMRQLFGDPQDTARIDDIVAHSANAALDICCGDILVAQMLKEVANISMTCPFGMDLGHSDPFQGNSFRDTRATIDSWCIPSYTWHHVTAREIEQLFAYEQTHVGNRELQYWEVYQDFIAPFVVSERVGWNTGAASRDLSEEGLMEREPFRSALEMYGKELSPLSNKDDCKKMCEIVDTCFVWSWWEGACKLELDGVMRGWAENEYLNGNDHPGITSGWMVERIQALKQSKECDPSHQSHLSEDSTHSSSDKTEGWYVRLLEEDGHELGHISEL